MTELLGPIMFAGLVIFLLSGFPVAFALAANGLLFGAIGVGMGLLTPDLLQALPDRVFGIMRNDTLLAIPFFTLMGLILERSGMAEELLNAIGELFGPIRGGLAYAVIFVGALLAATTGVVAAAVISMGLISLPIMLRYGYDRRVASGVIAASGTLAQIIPPSLVLIIIADQVGRSVGELYLGALVPGLLLAALYAGYIFLLSIFKPHWVPALPPEARQFREPNGRSGIASLLVLVTSTAGFGVLLARHFSADPETRAVLAFLIASVLAWLMVVLDDLWALSWLSQIARRVTRALVPPLALIFLVLGTIFIGVATPTEGGAMGAIGALLLAAANRKLDPTLLYQAVDKTARLAAFAMFILVGATVFSLVFKGVNGDLWVEHLLTQLPGGQTGFLIVVNLLVFLLAFFLDFFELAFIVVPLLAPIADKLGIDLVWFGVLLAVNMQTSFMHPPFGFALFYLRSVAPSEHYVDPKTGITMPPVRTSEIYQGALPFVVIQLLMVALIIAVPSLVQVSAKPVASEVPVDLVLPVESEGKK